MRPEALLVPAALVMALVGLVLFWDRPSRRWWFALTAVAAVCTVAVLVAVPLWAVVL